MAKKLKKRIIIADDEAVIITAISSQITTLGYEVVGIAANGRDALELVKKRSENPPGDETDVAGLIKEQASKWGLPESHNSISTSAA